MASLMVLFCACSPAREPTYVERISAARASKDAMLRKGPDPIQPSVKEKFLPLVYFEPDERYAIGADLVPLPAVRTLDMVYSDGTVRRVRQVGTLEFTLDGTMRRLMGFVEVGAPDDTLFVPFGDLTNGVETYRAGRLLDLRRTASGVYEIDFNLAYNPSCYFNPTYSCPVPPKENRLPIAIRAGERVKTE
jgi:uncharacterized protein (DUF1684 family)